MNREFFKPGNLLLIAIVAIVAIGAFNALTAHFMLSPAHASRAQTSKGTVG